MHKKAEDDIRWSGSVSAGRMWQLCTKIMPGMLRLAKVSLEREEVEPWFARMAVNGVTSSWHRMGHSYMHIQIFFLSF